MSKLAIDGGVPVRKDFLPFGAPCLGEEEYSEVLDTLKSGWIGTGPKCIRFESAFAEYVGAKHAIAVNSCTAGLFLGLLVAGVGPCDEVITSPLTFAATANVIIHVGAMPVFADIDPVTLNIDPKQIERAITRKTKAIIPVHFGGLACDMDAIVEIARSHGLRVVEDAAHAVGTRYEYKMIGSLGNITSFSFYANKNLTTAEGGMITTEDSSEAGRLEVLRLHGLSRDAWKRYTTRQLVLSDVVLPGYKFNLTDLAASLGIHQLAKQEQFIQVRERYAAMYDEVFSRMHRIQLQPRQTDPANRHSLHLYALILDPAGFTVSRNDIINALLAEGIGAALHYRALHTHPYYRDTFGYRRDDFPHAALIGENILSLPISPKMTENDIQDVITAVKKVLEAYRR